MGPGVEAPGLNKVGLSGNVCGDDGADGKQWNSFLPVRLKFEVQQIAYVLTIPKPIVDEAADEATKQTAMKQKQRWEEDDTYCKGYILGGLSDTLYDVYEIKYANSTVKELRDDLDSKYKTEDAGNKKFLISKLFDFRMVDSKSVITQIHELQMIMNLIISEGHSLDESFQVSTIISKLPLAWKECRKELKQKKDAMTMQELVKNRKSEDTVDKDQVHPTPEIGEGGELRRSKRARIEKTYGPDFYQFLVEGSRNEVFLNPKMSTQLVKVDVFLAMLKAVPKILPRRRQFINDRCNHDKLIQG
ncbi:hypothetical protein RJ639_001597 [Escallonia herrerae]|uniref:Zinc finger, CCHC-type n=1 Tax=Escallonia herrerae TaxID=1293975 RepID=A0AA88XBB3_9ASTE|nr:hypothetical protein RJ639_001597 [Escallonia herrerae]